MMGNKTNSLTKSEKGLVSFTIVIIIMILATLLVSSFAVVVRREQRRSLDRQLSSEAFYAAEAGVREAQTALNTTIDDGAGGSKPLLDADGNGQVDDYEGIETCSGPGSFVDTLAANGVTVDPVLFSNTEYSCVLIDPDPPNVGAKSVSPSDGSVLYPIRTANPIDSIRISWRGEGETYSSSNEFGLPKNGGLSSPMLRVSITPGLNSPLAATDFEQRTHTMFLYPNAAAAGSAGSIQYLGGGAGWGANYINNSEQGKFVNGNCNADNDGSTIAGKEATYNCNADIAIAPALRRTEYVVIVQPLYQQADLDIRGFIGNTRQNIEGSQAEIDVTGKSADVLRRINVRIPYGEGYTLRNNSSSLTPNAALETTESICKQWERTNDVADTGNLCDPGPITFTGGPSSDPCDVSFDYTPIINSVYSGDLRLQWQNILTHEIDITSVFPSGLPGGCGYTIDFKYGDRANLTSEQQCASDPSNTIACGAAAQDQEVFFIEGIDSSSGTDTVLFRAPSGSNQVFPDVPTNEGERDESFTTASIPPGSSLTKIRLTHPRPNPLLPPSLLNNVINAQSVHIYTFSIAGVV